MKRLCAAFAACCVFCFAADSGAQTAVGPANVAAPPGPRAEMTFDSGGSLEARSGDGLFERVAVLTNQAVAVRLRYSPDLAAKPILIESLDGAQVLGNAANLALGADGTATVQLRMGASEGLYRFAVVCGDWHTLLLFYASKPGNPSSDPTLLRPPSGG